MTCGGFIHRTRAVRILKLDGDPRRRVAARRVLAHRQERGGAQQLLAQPQPRLLEGKPMRAADAQLVLKTRSVLHGNSCDPGHILALAHIFGRPIVCFAAACVGEVRDPDASVATKAMIVFADAALNRTGLATHCGTATKSCPMFLPERLKRDFKVILGSLLHLENHCPHFPNFGYMDVKAEIYR